MNRQPSETDQVELADKRMGNIPILDVHGRPQPFKLQIPAVRVTPLNGELVRVEWSPSLSKQRKGRAVYHKRREVSHKVLTNHIARLGRRLEREPASELRPTWEAEIEECTWLLGIVPEPQTE